MGDIEFYCGSSDKNKCALVSEALLHISAMAGTINGIMDKILPEFMADNNKIMQDFVKEQIGELKESQLNDRNKVMEETKGIYAKIDDIKKYLTDTLRGSESGEKLGLFASEKRLQERIEQLEMQNVVLEKTIEAASRDTKEDKKFTISQVIAVAMGVLIFISAIAGAIITVVYK